MGTISRQTTWSTGDTLTASDINGEFDNILSTANGSLNADNLGVTAGQAAASKAIVLDSNKDFADTSSSNQIRNLTISGSLKIGTTFLPDASGGADLGSTALEWGDVYIADDKKIYLGSDQDISLQYDETTNNALEIAAAVEGAALGIVLKSDQGDDAGDEWKLNIADGGTLTLGNDIASAGTYVTHLTLTPNSTVSSSTLALAGGLTVAGTASITGVATVGGITIGSAVINEAELETIDGITAGTVAASKAVVVDANKDIGSFRNVTLTGELDAATGDFSGAVDIAGDLTLSAGADGALQFSAASSIKVLDNNSAALVIEEADNAYMTFVTTNSSEAVKFDKALDINAAMQIDATVTVGANDQGYDIIFYGDTASANMTWDTSADDLIFNGAAGLIVPDGQLTLGSTALAATAAELNVLDGVTAGTVAASKGVVVDANKDIGSFRNVTLTGELDAATLDISGNADIDGTTNLDAVDIDGAVQIDATVTVGVDDTGYDVKFFGATSGSSMLWDESADDLILTNAGLAVGSDATGDIYYRDSNGFLARLGVGSNGQVLTTNGTIPSWGSASGSGDFSGPGSATDNAIVRFNGTGGKTGQNSGVTIDDSNNATGFANLTLSGELDAATGDFSGDVNVAGELQTANIGYTDGDNAMTIADGGAVTFAQDAYVANGNGIVVGHTAHVAIGSSGEFQVFGTAAGDSETTTARFSADSGGPSHAFLKSRNGSIGSTTIVQDDDELGGLIWYADDGNDFYSSSARIFAAVDGSPSENDVPGRLVFATTADEANSPTERLRIDSSGNIGIGTSSPADLLHLSSSGALNLALQSTHANIANTFKINVGDPSGTSGTSGSGIAFSSNEVTRGFFFRQDGNVGIGTTSPDGTLHVHTASCGSEAANALGSILVLEDDDNNGMSILTPDNAYGQILWGSPSGDGATGDCNARIAAGYNSGNQRLDISVGQTNSALTVHDTGNVAISGALSKGSGSFRIDHPLPEKTDTHHLVHSFVEGPQADLIYRGTATLSSGTATINLDTAARMTDGTFVALNGNVQAFTTNESGWDAVRGSVSGNVLTIASSDNTSTASVSWLVIGERKDQHMLDTDWTGSDGRVITEPEKPVVEEAEEAEEAAEEKTAEEA